MCACVYAAKYRTYNINKLYVCSYIRVTNWEHKYCERKWRKLAKGLFVRTAFIMRE